MIVASLRRFLKIFLNTLSLILVSPASFTCWLERKLGKDSEELFLFWSHLFALFPGLPGVFLRRAFYVMNLADCTMDCYIGFGTIFTHRTAEVGKDVYVGAYALIGKAILGEGTLVGSHVSILSGKYQHELDDQGRWTPCSAVALKQVKIGPHAWIGEGAIVMADVGRSAMVAAGSVVSSAVPHGIMIAGNPAKFVKRIWEPEAGNG